MGVVAPPVCAHMVVPCRWVVLDGCNPSGSAADAGLDAAAWTRRAERAPDGGLVEVPEPSLGRHVLHELMRNAVLNLTLIIPTTAYQRRSYDERYSRYMIPPLPPSSKAKAIARPSSVAKPGSCPSPLPALSLPIGCPRAIRVIRVMCCPCSTRCNTPSTSSRSPSACRSTPWEVIWGSMTRSCATRCTSAAFSPWASRPRWSRSTRRRVPQEVLDILNASGLNRIRTPHQVHLACASGYSRPVVESHIATLMSRGAGHVHYKGLEGAVVQMGMTVMAHNGAVLVRIRQQRLSKRGQKFRRLLGLKRRKINQINGSKI